MVHIDFGIFIMRNTFYYIPYSGYRFGGGEWGRAIFSPCWLQVFGYIEEVAGGHHLRVSADLMTKFARFVGQVLGGGDGLMAQCASSHAQTIFVSAELQTKHPLLMNLNH